VNPTLIQLLSKAHDLKLVVDGVAVPLTIGTGTLANSAVALGPAEPNLYRLEDGTWNIQFNGRVLTRRKSVGLGCIHELLKQPNADIAASVVWAAQKGEIVGCKSEREFADEGFKELGLRVQSDRGEEDLPDEARCRLQDSLREMKEELAALEVSGEQGLAFEKRQEIKQVQEYLRQASFRGHKKRSSDGYEKARKRVSVGIARTIADLQAEHPALARHLDNSIRTGKYCRYAPETDVTWIL
jgi:hypothetical protein